MQKWDKNSIVVFKVSHSMDGHSYVNLPSVLTVSRQFSPSHDSTTFEFHHLVCLSPPIGFHLLSFPFSCQSSSCKKISHEFCTWFLSLIKIVFKLTNDHVVLKTIFIPNGNVENMFLPNLSQDTTEPKLSRDCTFDDNYNTLIVGILPRFLKLLTKDYNFRFFYLQ